MILIKKLTVFLINIIKYFSWIRKYTDNKYQPPAEITFLAQDRATAAPGATSAKQNLR